MGESEESVFKLEQTRWDMSLRISDFMRISREKIFCFLPDVSESEFYILKRWMDYFKERDIPFAITHDLSTSMFHLWKERRVLDDF